MFRCGVCAWDAGGQPVVVQWLVGFGWVGRRRLRESASCAPAVVVERPTAACSRSTRPQPNRQTHECPLDTLVLNLDHRLNRMNRLCFDPAQPGGGSILVDSQPYLKFVTDTHGGRASSSTQGMCLRAAITGEGEGRMLLLLLLRRRRRLLLLLLLRQRPAAAGTSSPLRAPAARPWPHPTPFLPSPCTHIHACARRAATAPTAAASVWPATRARSR